MSTATSQPDMFEERVARALLDQLLEDSRLYKTSKDYLELLEFTKRLRNFAPFNAMLLHVQKPGLRYAASAFDWKARFGRMPKENARPLLILWPFGPVALVYDVQDTEGRELPQDVDSFFARGDITQERIPGFVQKMGRKHIECVYFDGGDAKAGSIRLLKREPPPKETGWYEMQLNRNHTAASQFVTIAHELAHLFLGHLGPDKPLNIPERPRPNYTQRELEAESVAYLVCARNGVKSKSQTYLTRFVANNTTIAALDLYQVMRAAGQIESLLDLTSHTRYAPHISDRNTSTQPNPSDPVSKNPRDRATWETWSHDDIESARMVNQQMSLLPRTPGELCENLNLNWSAAADLFREGWLSFNPHDTPYLEDHQEAELLLVGSMVAAGCDSTMLQRLLHGLRKPYRYRPGRIYLDWATREWRLAPVIEEPDYEASLQDWLAQLAEEKDLAKLSELAQDIQSTIKSVKENN